MEVDSTTQQYPFWLQTPKGMRAFTCLCSQSPGGDPQLAALKSCWDVRGRGRREELSGLLPVLSCLMVQEWTPSTSVPNKDFFSTASI